MVEFKFVTGRKEELFLCPAPQSIVSSIQPASLGIYASGHYGSIYFHETGGYEGVHIWCWDYNIQQPTVLLCTSNEPFLDLHFMINNTVCFKIAGIGDMNFMKNQYNILYASRLQLECAFQKGLYRLLSFNFTPSYLQKWMEYIPLLRDFLSKVEHHIPGYLFRISPTATPEVIMICNSILHCRFEGDIKKMYLEAKTLELLALCLSRGSHTAIADNVALRSYDIGRIHEAQEYLLKNMDTPCSIVELAHKVGINDFKLKRGFKKIYGTTILDFVMEARMERARILLLETDTPVHQIALRTGYKNVSSFTAAFKVRFGYPPSFLRKNG